MIQAMDSRFRGNGVISARRATFTLAVIPAKAGIHFGQRIPKLEFTFRTMLTSHRCVIRIGTI